MMVKRVLKCVREHELKKKGDRWWKKQPIFFTALSKFYFDNHFFLKEIAIILCLHIHSLRSVDPQYEMLPRQDACLCRGRA
jgi:hypothetical protein